MDNHTKGKWGIQADGTYINPILNADYSDPDVVRDGERYYMISSTIQCSPGMVILESEDLVNWKTIGSVIPNPDELYPYLGCGRMGAYDKGIYAGSIRHLFWKEPDGKGALSERDCWFVYTTIFQGGILVSTADSVYGPWHTRFMLDKNGKELRSPFLEEEKYGKRFSDEELKGNRLPGIYWDDNCPYWEFEKDGTLKAAYMVASKTNGAWYPHVFRMSLDGTMLLDGELESMSAFGDYSEVEGVEGCVIRKVVSGEALKVFRAGSNTEAGNGHFQGRHGGSEKVSDYLYLFDSEVNGEGIRVPLLHRAKCIYGDRFDEKGRYLGPGSSAQPGEFETICLMDSKKEPIDEREPNQGAFVDVPASRSCDGQEHWYFITHHGNEKAGPDGRPVSLLEVRWVEGWPIPGFEGDGREAHTGNMQWQGKMPVKGYGKERGRFQDSDNFGEGIYGGRHNSNSQKLSPDWFWNHAPKNEFWSLKEREGWLRMYAFETADGSDDFFKIGNVLAQRYIDSPQVLAQTQMSLCGMCAGQRAGLAHFNGGKWYSSLSVRKERDGTFSLFRLKKESSKEKQILKLPEDTALLCLQTRMEKGKAWFRFRLENEKEWHEADGKEFSGEQLCPGGYRGDCIGLYTYNNQGQRGYVDFNYFRYEW